MIRALISEEKEICILWSPKAGSATACEIFFKYCNIDYSKHKWIHDARIEYQNKFYTRLSKIDLSSFKIFQIVRNPYTRCISSFFHYLKYCNNDISFNDYLTRLLFNQLSCETGSYHSCIQFMTDKLLGVLKLENLESDIDSINQKFGLNLEYAKYDTHSWSKKIENKKDISHVPKKYQVPYEEIIDKQSIDLIQRIYHKDIEYFQYTCPYIIGS